MAGEAARIKVEGLLLDHIGQPSGSLLVVDAEGRAAAEAFAAEGPCRSKRVFERVEIRRWRAAPGSWIG